MKLHLTSLLPLLLASLSLAAPDEGPVPVRSHELSKRISGQPVEQHERLYDERELHEVQNQRRLAGRQTSASDPCGVMAGAASNGESALEGGGSDKELARSK